MNYYNKIDDAYIAALKSQHVRYRTMIQPLDHWENALGECEADILTSKPVQSQQTAGNNIRRSLNISVVNADDKYSPSKNSAFWYSRKFRLWDGVAVGENVYWQEQGIYYSLTAEEENHVITISAADKFAALNGELNTGRCTKPFTTDITASDVYVADLIRETLMLNTGSLPLDPISPVIDPYFESAKLYADIALDAGQFYGEILTTLAGMFGADCCYDRSGRLNFRRKAVTDRPWWYQHQGYAWNFTDNDVNIVQGVRRSTTLRAVNCVTVMTDNTEGEFGCYTAKNTNPESPVCVQNVGEQYPDDPIVYIALGDTTRDTPNEKCRQYADYLLMQHTQQALTETFTTVEIPHLKADDMILLHGEPRLITSISTDHHSRLMQLEVCNTAFLPINYETEVIESE